MTHRTRNRQPHWITPLVTLTPLLEQEYRFDAEQEFSGGMVGWQWGGGKGLELIPAPSMEAIVFQPNLSCISHQCSWGAYGGLLKYRLAAAPEKAGNYVATAFFSASHSIHGGTGQIAPGFGWGKGYGRFDLQQAFSFGFLTGQHAYTPVGMNPIYPPNRQITLNTALQYRLPRHFWPELEYNATWLAGGSLPGHTGTWITPGLVLGPYRLHGDLAFTFGAGEQIPLSSFPANYHNLIFSFRLPF